MTGSRGKGFANQWSDYDCAIFVRDDAIERFERQYLDVPAGGRLYIFTLDSFKERMVWKGSRHWERYTWAHLTVESDRTQGEIQRLLSEASHVPLEHANDHMRQSLRWFLNQVYHSLKNLRAGNLEGHHLEAAECVRPFLEAVFCLHDRRVLPYYKYLRWELESYPLYKLSLSVDELLSCITEILTTGNYRVQQQLLREAKRVFSEEGFAALFEWQMSRFCLDYSGEPGMQCHE